MSRPDDDDECPGCGSSHSDRQERAKRGDVGDEIPTGLTQCPFCDSWKCCMCDMGDDVECGNCPDED